MIPNLALKAVIKQGLRSCFDTLLIYISRANLNLDWSLISV